MSLLLPPGRCVLLFLVMWGLSGNAQQRIVLEWQERFDDAGDTSAAIHILEAHLKGQPNDAEALWRLSKQYCDLALESPDKKVKTEMQQKARQVAESALACHPQDKDDRTTLELAKKRLKEILP